MQDRCQVSGNASQAEHRRQTVHKLDTCENPAAQVGTSAQHTLSAPRHSPLRNQIQCVASGASAGLAALAAFFRLLFLDFATGVTVVELLSATESERELLLRMRAVRS